MRKMPAKPNYFQRNWVRLLCFTLFCLYLYIVAKVCFMNSSEIMEKAGKFAELLKKLGEHDKIVHFCLFFPYPVLAFFCMRPYNTTFFNELIFFVVVMLLGASLAFNTECAQGIYFPSRSFDIKDFFADALGMGISGLLLLAGIIYYRLNNKIK